MVLSLQLTQPFLKLGLFRHELAAQYDDHLLVKLPQLLQGHRLQVFRFHWTPREFHNGAGIRGTHMVPGICKKIWVNPRHIRTHSNFCIAPKRGPFRAWAKKHTL